MILPILKLADSTQLRFGGGNDLRIYHDGSNSYVQDAGTGTLNSFWYKMLTY